MLFALLICIFFDTNHLNTVWVGRHLFFNLDNPPLFLFFSSCYCSPFPSFSQALFMYPKLVSKSLSSCLSLLVLGEQVFTTMPKLWINFLTSWSKISSGKCFLFEKSLRTEHLTHYLNILLFCQISIFWLCKIFKYV